MTTRTTGGPGRPPATGVAPHRDRTSVPRPGQDPRARLAAAAPGLTLPGRSPLGDRRGLTLPGAVALVVVVGGLAAALDLTTGAGLRAVFAVAFTLACGLAALAVHRERLRATVVMPPLLYLAFALVAGTVDGSTASGGWLQRQVVEVASALVYQAPVIFAATGAAAATALLRHVGDRR